MILKILTDKISCTAKSKDLVIYINDTTILKNTNSLQYPPSLILYICLFIFNFFVVLQTICRGVQIGLGNKLNEISFCII